ncbi:MAG: prolipoprotein diacylglyceryl transferase [Sphaerochaetaceae bacterium]|nr:prolipoprotein diacylglyceryl transferase [Sphaerochaetaceae bacterium]
MFLYCDFPSWIRPEVIPGFPVRWYAVMYIVAFTICYVLFRYQCRKENVLKKMSADMSQTAFTYVIFGLLLGARLGSVLIYEGNSYYWTHPWMILWPFRNGVFVGLPGMSYHGGVVGALLGAVIFCRTYKYDFWEFTDTVIAGIPIGYTFGRLGNFINGELWGRCTGSSYGMIFPEAPLFSTASAWVREAADKAGISYVPGDWISLPRHPSQLYEAFFEGIVTFLIVWFVVRPYVRKPENRKCSGIISGSYFFLYAFFRFFIEYFREPDSQLGFIIALGKETEPTALFKSVLNFSMGQILCALMMAGGIIVIVFALKRGSRDRTVKHGK